MDSLLSATHMAVILVIQICSISRICTKPLIILIYDVHRVDKHSKIKLYDDDVTFNKEIKCETYCNLLQEDRDRICDWTEKWHHLILESDLVPIKLNWQYV